VHELITADSHSHVRRSASDRSEEDEIARLDARYPHICSKLILLTHFSRQGDAMLREDVLDEPAAVEAGGIRPAIPVGHTAEPEGSLDHCCGIDGDSRRARGGWRSRLGGVGSLRRRRPGKRFGDPTRRRATCGNPGQENDTNEPHKSHVT
jgi:hypothetical protein